MVCCVIVLGATAVARWLEAPAPLVGSMDTMVAMVAVDGAAGVGSGVGLFFTLYMYK